MKTRLTPCSLARGVAELSARDADLARIHHSYGLPPMRTRPAGFPALLQIIVEQQVSVASARAIWGRMAAAADSITPESFLALGEADLKAVGLSRAKMAYGRALATDILEGRLALDSLSRLQDEEAIAALVTVKGIGRWTAEIYLLSALARPDVWPVGDLAVATATGLVKGLDHRPDRAEMLALGEAWRPWRSVASRLLWHYFRNAVRGQSFRPEG